MTSQNTPEKEAQIPTNLRLLLLVEEIARRGVATKAAELMEPLGLPKPTLHRLLQTAEEEGFLQRDIDGRSYGPGPRLRSLAANTMSSEHLRTARLAILRAVAEEIGETCNLATPDRDGMTYLDRVETKWPLRIQLPVGTKVPFHCTASGKLHLSTLRQAALTSVLTARPLDPMTAKTLTTPEELRQAVRLSRTQGYATDDEEFMEGMAAVAVPVLGPQNRLVATLSVHAPIQRHSLTQLLDFLPQLKTAAAQLSDLMCQS